MMTMHQYAMRCICFTTLHCRKNAILNVMTLIDLVVSFKVRNISLTNPTILLEFGIIFAKQHLHMLFNRNNAVLLRNFNGFKLLITSFVLFDELSHCYLAFILFCDVFCILSPMWICISHAFRDKTILVYFTVVLTKSYVNWMGPLLLAENC